MVTFVNKAIEIIGDIGESWFGEGITAKSIADQLTGVASDEALTLTVGSLGGNVADALAIYGMLRSHGGGVSGKIVGMTASSGTIVAMATTKGNLAMDSGAMFLIHNTSTGAFGNSDAMQKTADELRAMDMNLANIYATRTGKPVDEILALMRQERWLSATEALDWGFVDSIYKGSDAQNAINKDRAANLLGLFKNVNIKSKQIKIQNQMTDDEIKALEEANAQLQAQVEELTAQLAEFQKKEADAQAATEEAEIEAALEEKEMPEEAKAQFKAMAKKDFTNTLAVIKSLPKVVATKAGDVINAGNVTNAATKEELIAKFKQMKKEGKLARWSVENKAEYDAAYAAVKETR